MPGGRAVQTNSLFFTPAKAIEKCDLFLSHIYQHEHTLPSVNFTPEQLRFASIPARSARADFAGSGLSSDLGPVLLRGVDLQIGLTHIAAALPDRRHRSYVSHSYHGIVPQRIYQIGCGDDDRND
ncbi:transposase [Massilia psychrophila]|uniref:Transposase DDE domain-containing protein n=1 Tax=Massilia psychrophila TaxID=1603353 RepID=A0A2G8SX46_9BURK|nr:hypothetical protein CR103_18630 [Massilia psychrophila]